ncbi:hypothetical protein IE81DRAFT_319632 [Ceraceosorus guamensis]|uniref:SAP domain-containing protein n=1 Tax=Ceraceosorus guamensis TaxID=1522189 RepID=A0A316W7G2_9BASI|nr:hypothetical protein IE81DRAFT_319632 [Ceraceosorus guamensis]PWN45799.1 hypothetical protein IE81DRAFT_319632 [Ceraceosorus guamensis]
MVSTVLLSRDSYQAAKATELKAELKSRGLSTTGKRADLIQRLLDNDGKRAAGVPNVTKPSAASGNSSTASRRLSTTPAPQAAPATESNVANTAELDSRTNASVPHPPNILPGQVSNSKDALPDLTKLSSPDSNPPGLPPIKNPKPAAFFDVKIPYYEPPPVSGPQVPLFTAYFDPTQRGAGSAEAQRPYVPPRKISIAAGADVAHTLGDVTLPEDISLEQSTSGRAAGGAGAIAQGATQSMTNGIKELLGAFRRDLGIAEPSAETQQAAAKVSSKILEGARVGADVAKVALGEASAAISNAAPDRASTSGNDDGTSSSRASYSPQPAQFSASDSTGLYVLLGILLGGYTLGGLLSPSGKKHQKKIATQLEGIRKEAELEVLKVKISSALDLPRSFTHWSDKDVAHLVARAEEVLQLQKAAQ